MEAKLMKMIYYDPKAEVRLEAYADTVVIEKDVNTSYLAAIRFGGYPESVKGMSEAIYGGGSVSIEIDGTHTTVYSRVKQYRKEFSHDGIYAEATLMIQDEEQHTDNAEDDNTNSNAKNNPRKCYLFCEQGDKSRLFEELDKKTSVPLIPEFRDHVLGELQKRGVLKQLIVISSREKFDVWALTLSKDEENVISVVNDGLKSGTISIPGAAAKEFPAIQSVTQYLNTFGVMIAERIKSQFNPLFDPATESLSQEILTVNDYIKENAGYSLYDAQLAIAEAHKRCLTKKKATLCISECGSGKTKIGITALHAYQQRNGAAKNFNIVLCPSHMTKKWVREIEESLPNTFALVVTSINEINTAYETYQNDTNSNGTDFLIYDLEALLAGRLRNANGNRKKWNPMLENAKGILRVEVRLTKPKAIRTYTNEIGVSEQISELLEKSKDIFLGTFTQAVPFGDFHKKDRAVEIIRREIKDVLLRRKMMQLVTLIPEKKSLLLAQKALNHRRIDDVMEAFAKINVSPVTLSKRHEIKHLENLYTYLENFK